MAIGDAGFTSLPVFALKGARIPSMADDVATERNTLRSRVTGSRM